MTALSGHLKKMEQVIEEERYQDYADSNYDLQEACLLYTSRCV